MRRELERFDPSVPIELAGEPVLVLRDSDELRAFFNVCRHHASHLVEGEGHVDRLTCPYHGWCYDLDGSLRSAPRLGGIQQFDRDRHPADRARSPR